jgi:hypothetical protein
MIKYTSLVEHIFIIASLHIMKRESKRRTLKTTQSLQNVPHSGLPMYRESCHQMTTGKMVRITKYYTTLRMIST